MLLGRPLRVPFHDDQSALCLDDGGSAPGGKAIPSDCGLPAQRRPSSPECTLRHHREKPCHENLIRNSFTEIEAGAATNVGYYD
jgi:hypothetical protein